MPPGLRCSRAASEPMFLIVRVSPASAASFGWGTQSAWRWLIAAIERGSDEPLVVSETGNRLFLWNPYRVSLGGSPSSSGGSCVAFGRRLRTVRDGSAIS
jgi:hypothetical protein